MEIYFLTRPYDRNKISRQLEILGYLKEERYGGYGLADFLVRVNLTSALEGKVQIQGRLISDIEKTIKKGKDSEQYKRLKELIEVFRPERIVDALMREILHGLIEDASSAKP